MKEAMDFLKNAGVYFLATTEGDQPHVRPIGFVMEWEGKLAFCTGNNKEMCRQMAKNPKVEISCVDKECNTLRICGEVKFITSELTQRKALEVMPSLGQIYAVGDGRFEIFCLENAKAVCSSMSGEKTQIQM